jgi:uncharacterized protein with beta-barrel porin domain
VKSLHAQSKNNQTISQAEIKESGFFATALSVLLLFFAIAAPALAVDAVWNAIPLSGDWNSSSNWTPAVAPVNAGDAAAFNTSTVTSLSLTGAVTIDSMTFNLGADAFNFRTQTNSFSFVGVGIVNNSVETQTIFNVAGTVNFLNSSSAANTTISNANFGSGVGFPGTNFRNTSSAGNATIQNDSGGTTNFLDSSNAGNATISNSNSGSGAGGPGITNFRNTATAANANITNSGLGTATNFFDTSVAGNATIQNDTGGTTNFFNSSTADNATIGNGNGGTTNFSDTSTAGNATIGNDIGGTTNFSGTSTAGNATIGNDFLGVTNFLNSSTAGNATIININSGSGAGGTNFNNTSTAANATIINSGVDSTTIFFDTSTAGNATITNSGAGSETQFFDTSTAGNATITNSGAGSVTQFADTSTAGNATITNSGAASVTEFFNSSTAANATITNAGANSRIDFFGSSSGGNAALINANSTAVIDISGLTVPATTVGSIAGNGSLFLGGKDLTVGGNQTSTVFSGVIQDGGGSGGTGGSLTKVGAGALTLTRDNTYTGSTIVDGGSLIVDGSISSGQTFVNPGGLLGGNGTIGGDLTNDGIVSPGNSPGTLTVAGDYTQTAGGTLRIEIAGTAPGQFDLLSVGGSASLAGTLQLVRLGNFKLHVGDTITFLTADSVSGTFDTIQNPFTNTLVLAEIIYLPGSVELVGTQGSFTSVACNPNTLAVAKALDSAVGDPRAAGLIQFLDTQPLSALCPELELISPEELAAMFNIGVSLANIQSVNLERRMEDIRAGSTGFSARGFSIDRRVPDFSPGLAGPTGPEGKSGPPVMQPTPENRWGIFVTGLGEFTSVDDTSIAPGYNFSTGGLTFGVDYRVSPNFAIGLTGGYAHTNADLVNDGSLDVDGGTIGAYATGFAGGFYIDAAAFGVFNGYDDHRTALLGTASGDTDGRDFNALIAAGYDWKSGGLTVGPTVSYQYTYVEFDGFTEHGSLAPLTFSDQNAHSSRTALGAKASYDWQVGHVVVKPELRASWQHEFGDRDYSIVSRFANGAGNSFTVNGPEIGRDSLLIGAGAAVLLNDRVSVYAYYDGELARTNYISNNVSAGLRVTF